MLRPNLQASQPEADLAIPGRRLVREVQIVEGSLVVKVPETAEFASDLTDSPTCRIVFTYAATPLTLTYNALTGQVPGFPSGK